MSAGAFGSTTATKDPDTFDVRASLQSITNAVRLHKALVAGTTIATLALVTAYILYWPPVYEATSMLMVERDTDPVRDTFYVGWNVFRKDDARTEIELMTSAPILLEIIRKEKLRYDDVYHPFMSHVTYLWQKSWVGRNYRKLKESFLGKPPITIDPLELEKMRTAVDMRAGISIEPIAESNAGRITVKGPSDKVARIANQLMDTYMASRLERHYDEAKRSLDVLTDQMKLAKDDLVAIEQRRLQFLQSNGLMFDFQKESLEISKLSDLEQNINNTTVRIASLETTLSQTKLALAQEPNTRTVSTLYEANAMRESTKLKRREMELQLIQTLERYREDSPEVRDIRRDLAEMDKLIASSSERVEKGTTEGLNAVAQDLNQRRINLEAELAGSRASLRAMQDIRAGLRTRLLSIPSLQAQLRSIDREYGLAQEKYQQILSKQTQSSVSLITTRTAMPSMRIVEYATPPQDKTLPKPKIVYPAGLVVGLMLGTFAALLATYSSARLRRDQIEGGRGSAEFYGTVEVPPRAIPFVVAPDNPGRTQSGAR
ncbi:MAG: GumC family protein [Bryobacterales bacterium]|nr:GumC family protein [Bryobacterales bacterium]